MFEIHSRTCFFNPITQPRNIRNKHTLSQPIVNNKNENQEDQTQRNIKYDYYNLSNTLDKYIIEKLNLLGYKWRIY